MTSPDHNTTSAVRMATVVSALLIGYQVAGKATRDALFLSHFPVTMLPRMVAAAAIISLVAALATSRIMRRLGPGRLVPIFLTSSAFLQVVSWLLLPVVPRVATVMVYIQFNAMGALMVSAFWSLINERFDPRSGKRAVGFIGTAGTVGGVAGGLLAERAGALWTVAVMLPILAVVHIAAAALVIRIRTAPARPAARPSSAGAPAAATGGFRALAASPYLRLLAASVLLGTVCEGLLDYVFKAHAKVAYAGHGDALLRLFALFYTGTNLVGGLISAGVGRRVLEKFGLARTVSVLPWTVAVGGVGAIAIPGLPAALIARFGEATIRGSLYRSGYELLFTPLPPDEKRAAKPLLDVGAVRIGDMLAALCVQLALIAWAAHALTLMLMLAVVSAVAGIVLTFRIHEGYVSALERNLVARAGELEMGEVLERPSRMTMMQTMTRAITQDRKRPGRQPRDLPDPGAAQDSAPAQSGAAESTPQDPVLARLADLHAYDITVVRNALRAGLLESPHIPRAIALLANDDVAHSALDALSAVAASHTGQLIDALLDPTTDFAVRRRIPAAIASARSARALDGLLSGLHDARFEVRVRCGHALAHLVAGVPDLVIDRQRVMTAVLNEVAVGHDVWESQRPVGEDRDDPLQLGDALRERSSRSLEHVFIVLSLILPRQPLQIAFQGLHTEDPQLRGTALEYLETALPVPVRERLWPFIGDRPREGRPTRPREQVVADLVASRSSIVMSLEDIERQLGNP